MRIVRLAGSNLLNFLSINDETSGGKYERGRQEEV